MTALAERETEAPKTLPAHLFFATLFLVVTAGLIVCHGCHAGDHDDELSIPVLKEAADD
jgi:hypothetical protein